MQLIVNYPEKLPDALQQSSEQFEREAKMAMAVKLYEMKRVSSGRHGCGPGRSGACGIPA